MKVLYHPIINVEPRPGNRFLCDYMVDCMYHGFKSLLGQDLEESIALPQWYTDVNKTELYGNGFTVYGLIDRNQISLAGTKGSIGQKIKDGYYDQIMLPIHNNAYRDSRTIDTVARIVTYNVGKVKVICGNDDSYINQLISNFAPFFKREVYTDILPYNVFPITFSVPEEKILDKIPQKLIERSEETPNHNGVEGWKIKNEAEYYKKYQDAIYAITYKKGGWDCMRHYEIMMNGCFPYFIDLDKCPRYTLHFFPKEYVMHIMNKKTVTESDLKFILEFTKEHLTTKKMAKYVLEV